MTTTMPSRQPPTVFEPGYRSVIHISEGPIWAEATWLGCVRSLNAYEYGTPFGPAIYERIDVADAGCTWNARVVGKFLHPKTGEVLGWAWQHYR